MTATAALVLVCQKESKYHHTPAVARAVRKGAQQLSWLRCDRDQHDNIVVRDVLEKQGMDLWPE